MSRKWTDGMTVPQLGFFLFLVVLLAISIVAFQAWLLGIVLSWFGIALSFWQNVLIVILIGMLFGGSRYSSN